MAGEKPGIKVVSFSGPALSGKDYQGKLLADTYQHVARISTGHLLRDPALLKSSGHEQDISYINAAMQRGVNIRDRIVEDLIHSAIARSIEEGNTTIILAGHPRTIEQMRDMREWIAAQNEAGIPMEEIFVRFPISLIAANKRRKKRYEQEKRGDDKKLWTTLRRRWEYSTSVLPMLAVNAVRRLSKTSIPVYKVNASKSPEEVTAQLKTILAPYLPNQPEKTLPSARP